jgi:hypothetical protein
MESGVDSLAATELHNALQQELNGLKVPSILVFDFPTVDKMAQFIHSKLQPVASMLPLPLASSSVVTDAELAISVCGALCTTPSHAHPYDLWQSLSLASDSARSIPIERFDVVAAAAMQDTELQVQHGHFIAGTDLFEPTLFGMSTAEVTTGLLSFVK